MKSAVKHLYDADANTLLRAIGSAAVTVTTNGSAVPLDTLTDAYWDNNEIPLQGFTAFVGVTALDTGEANETYTFTVEVDTTDAFASAVVVGTLTVTAVGEYEINLDGDAAAQLEPGATHLRLVATLGGTTPSLTYYGWLTPIVK